MSEISLFAPATIANISCGFDVLGLCLDAIGDRMVIRENPLEKLRITHISGADLPYDIKENVAGVAATALLNHLNISKGYDIEIYKGLLAGSGLGSSAASAAGIVYGINSLLGSPLTTRMLIPFAMEGERLACGNAHADNVAPALLGGFTLVRSYDPLDIISLPVPKDLFATVIHPQIELKTSDARSLLKSQVPLKEAISQWGNLGGFISGLYTEDYELISRSMVDKIVEPLRAVLIPQFHQLKKEALIAGALGSGISGSGPSVFALSKGKEVAHLVASKWDQIYAHIGVDYNIHISSIAPLGVREYVEN